jgi:hypothetical protein
MGDRYVEEGVRTKNSCRCMGLELGNGVLTWQEWSNRLIDVIISNTSIDKCKRDAQANVTNLMS